MRAPVLREIVCVEAPGGGRAHLVLFANERYLPLESAYPEQVRAERGKGLRLGQVALLESDGSASAIIRLVAAAWRRFRALELDIIYIVVDADDVALYTRLLFEKTPWGQAKWDFADYATVEVMRLNVSSAEARATDSFRRRFMRESQ